MNDVKVVCVDTPLLRPMPFSKRYRLEVDMECRFIGKDGLEKRIVIPSGFITDGASIPRPLWSLVGSPYLPEFITGAIVHDWCCDNDWDVSEMSELFFELLLLSNVGSTKAALMEDAVEIYKTFF